MVYSYEELLKMKQSGINLNWDEISKEQLESLFIDENISNNTIAELYNVSPDKVRYKRKKWGISFFSSKSLYRSFAADNEELLLTLNEDSKERLMGKENIDWIAKALTHYLFRNGPVEDMHANNQLSQQDMKTLNKYMVNKIAGLLSLINDGEWLKIEMLLAFLSNYGTEWDPAEIDTKDIDTIFQHTLEDFHDSFKAK